MPGAPVSMTVPEYTKTGLILLTWDAVANVDGYEVQEARLPDFTDARTIYRGEGVAFRYNKGRSGTYFYRVRAFKN